MYIDISKETQNSIACSLLDEVERACHILVF